MKKVYFSYLSSNKKNTINAVKWLPEFAPKGIIQIAHGITEYIERYQDFAFRMTAEGYIVVGNDTLGHGRSTINDKKNYLGELGSWRYAVEDIKTCHDMIMNEYPRLPIYLIGFSMGSFLVRQYLSDYNPRVYSTFLIGTGYQSGFLINMVKKTVKKEIDKYGEDNTSTKVKELSFGTYNKKFEEPETDFDWLSSKKSAVQEYMDDPMISKEITTSLFYELLTGIAYTSSNKCIDKMNKSMPIIIISGQDDPVGDMGKGVTKYYNKLKKKGFKTALKLYPDMRHDLFHEQYTSDVIELIRKYMK